MKDDNIIMNLASPGLGSAVEHSQKNGESIITKTNTKIHNIFTKLQTISFYLLVSMLIGFAFGVFSSYKFYEMKMEEYVKLEGFIYKSDIYNLIKRDITLKVQEQKPEVKSKKEGS